jgi:hypothetical protein
MIGADDIARCGRYSTRFILAIEPTNLAPEVSSGAWRWHESTAAGVTTIELRRSPRAFVEGVVVFGVVIAFMSVGIAVSPPGTWGMVNYALTILASAFLLASLHRRATTRFVIDARRARFAAPMARFARPQEHRLDEVVDWHVVERVDGESTALSLAYESHDAGLVDVGVVFGTEESALAAFALARLRAALARARDREHYRG